ncbi:hypothetical protein JCM10207_007795 [Rhodosporidiobolus poonsookiae]
MSTPPTGQCLMCGAETTQRCSACAAAELDLFFCSTEHQKLLWPVHRDVCGANSNPFRWPLLSNDEVDDASKNLTVAQSGEASLQGFMSMIGAPPSISPSFLKFGVTKLLSGVRSSEFHRLRSVAPAQTEQRLVLGRRVYALRLCSALYEWMQLVGHETKSWFRPLLHHLLAYSTIDYFVHASSGTEERTYKDMANKKHTQIVSFLREVVQPLDGEAAAAALAFWDGSPDLQWGDDNDSG